MEKVKIELVGCGLFGESHLQAFRALRTAEVTALYDPARGWAERIARDFGIPNIFDSLEEICARPELNAIDVVTPEHIHVDSVLSAIGNGKHVFVEKPLALDLGQCEEMIAAATSAKRILMVDHLLRFETKYSILKDEIMAGHLGKLVSMHA